VLRRTPRHFHGPDTVLEACGNVRFLLALGKVQHTLEAPTTALDCVVVAVTVSVRMPIFAADQQGPISNRDIDAIAVDTGNLQRDGVALTITLWSTLSYRRW